MGNEELRCECVDCRGESNTYYKVKLLDEFDGDEVIWCQDCLIENSDMVDSFKLLSAGDDYDKIIVKKTLADYILARLQED